MLIAACKGSNRRRLLSRTLGNSMPIRDKGNFLVFGSPKVEEGEIREVEAVIRSGWLGTGPRVAQFECEFRRYRGASHAVALSSCSAALHLSLLASGVGPRDQVITTPLTFCATVNAILHVGATPVLADIDPAAGARAGR